MKASILSIATAVPPHCFSQGEMADTMVEMLALQAEKARKLRRLYAQSAINQRYSVIPDFQYDRSQWSFWGSEYPKVIPGTEHRNQAYKHIAPQLSHTAAHAAINRWGGDAKAITHVIAVSCTGMIAPGIEFDLMHSLQLNSSVHRLGINFMGCFGAFKGLATANAFAKENPTNRILLVCTELCTLHMQSDDDIETLTGNAIFADGAAAVIVGAEPKPEEMALWEIIHGCSMSLAHTRDKMTWEAGNHGFQMRLSQQVPVLLKRHIKAFVDQTIRDGISYSDCDWAIHPGGKSILQAVQKEMALSPLQTEASWHTLANYGNMSSATFLFVLDRLLARKSPKEWSIGLGFGPGLSMEGLLLRKKQNLHLPSQHQASQ